MGWIISAECSKILNNFCHLENFYASPKRYYEQVRFKFDNFSRNISLKPRFLCWKFKTDEKVIFGEQNFSSKCFSGMVEFTFDNPSENCLLKVPYCFAESSKLMKILGFCQNSLFSTNFYFGHVECRFDNRSKKIPLKFKKFSAQRDEMTKKPNFPRGSTQESFLDLTKAVLKSLLKLVCTKFRDDGRTFKKKFFIEVFL